MKVLIVHNYYQLPGGEDTVFASECELLRQHGHEVTTYTEHNNELQNIPQTKAAVDAVWSRRGAHELKRKLDHERPDIVHFHNTFLRISPSAYYVCQNVGVPVVQTLHNYRTFCPAATFFRDGQVCEDCLGRTMPIPAIIHRCWRKSRAQTSVVAAMLATHRLLGTWQRQVTLYIALTEFARQKFIEGGLAPEKVVVKPNFARSHTETGTGSGGFALFVGRLSPEKGIEVMLNAWEYGELDLPLKIVGDGPLKQLVNDRSAKLALVDYRGKCSQDEVLSLMKQAAVLIFPSIWYEGFPMVIAEAFSVGLPVLTSRLGSMVSIVEDRQTGIHFSAGDSEDLARKIREISQDPRILQRMRGQIRDVYIERYSPEANYQQLVGIYERALELSGRV